MTLIGGTREEFDPSVSPVRFSPDGQQLVIVTRHGDLDRNTNVYSLLLFRTAEVFKSPQPQRLLSVSSANNSAAIEDPRWLADSRTIVYIARSPGRPRQVFSLDVKSGRVKQLTRQAGDIQSFTIGGTLGTLAFLASEPKLPEIAAGREVVVSDQPLFELITGRAGAAPSGLFLQRGRSVQRIDTPGARRLVGLRLSKDGRFIVGRAQVDSPDKLQSYQVDLASGRFQLAEEDEKPEAAGAADPLPRSRIDVGVEQDMNTRPRLFAADVKSGRRALLFDPNPWMRGLELGEVREIPFKGTDGEEYRGGLYLPVGFTSGRRYPLIIQTHGWNSRRFALDGESSAGYAAQVLAGLGFVVAQLPFAKELSNPREGPQNMAMYEGLIDELDRQSMIDRARVGIQAWSRTGYSVRYALVFSRYHFAAAALIDSMDAGYGQYLSWLNVGPSAVSTYEALHGAAPFGVGLESWMQRAPSFNVDRLSTPVRISVFSANTLLDDWEWFSASRYLHKPVEMTWLADSNHWPVRPSDRLAIQQGTVDWFRFWLKGERDTDHAKDAQYVRWDALVSHGEPTGIIQTTNIAASSIATLRAEIDSGQLTARDVVRQELTRVDRLDRSGPTLNSIIEVNPAAIGIAEGSDHARSERREARPLEGIPILLKDNIDTADSMLTTGGSLALLDSHPDRDAFIVTRLRNAGSVILGKTNLSEWANFRGAHSSSGWSARGGQTRNPYALDRSPCGSSSGSAVAVAAGLAVAAVGTETDGSIVCPASVNGIVGIKPTVGLVSRSGIIPISTSQDTAGPMARTVADAAALLNALAGYDPADPATAHLKDHPPPDFTASLKTGSLEGARIGVVRRSAGFNRDVDEVFERALDTMRARGATLIDPVEVTKTPLLGADENVVLLYEFKDGINRYLGQRAGNGPKSLAELIAFNERERRVEMPFFGQELFIQAQRMGPLTDTVYIEARARARESAGPQGIDAALAKDRLDALVAPSSGPAWALDPIDGDHSTGGSIATAPAVAGYPHVSVPMGDVHGLPVGLSFVGAAWSDSRLIGLAYAFEQATHARKTPVAVELSP